MLFLFPGTQESPAEAETHKPGVAIVVGVEVFSVEVCAFDIEFIVADCAITAIETDGELFELETCFEFGVECGGHGAVVTVSHASGAVAFGAGNNVVGREVDVQQVEADAHGRNQVEECVFAEGFPAEHPIDTVVKPACVVEREGGILSVFIHGGRFVRRSFGNLRNCKVDVEPGQELLVLRTNVEVEAGVVLVEFAVFGVGGKAVDGRVPFVLQCSPVESFECQRVDVPVEVVEHATEVSAEGDEATDVFLVVKSFFGSG